MQYEGFAQIYDRLIEQDYDAWAAFLEQIFQEYKKPELVLDLACGTGGVTIPLARAGYDMIGVDSSEDMLAVAREKSEGLQNILWLCQDMTNFELYGTVDAVISILDGINYITSPQELNHTFSLVHNYLNPDGLFLFDFSSKYKLSHVLGNNTFVQETEDVFYVWENEYENNICKNFLTFFIKNGQNYNRVDEEHTQRAYSVHEIKQLLKKNGFSVLKTVESLTEKSIVKSSQRITMICKKIC